MEKQWKRWQTLFGGGLQNHSDGDCSHKIKKTLAPGKKSYDKPRQCITKQRHHFANKGPYNQRYGFSSSHVRIWVLDLKEGWVLKNWCFRTVVLEKTLESPLDSEEIKPANRKGNQFWIFIGRTGAEAPILWPLDAKSRLLGKDPDAGKDWGQEEKGVTEDVMVGWHYRLDEHEFEQAPGVADGQGSLACLGVHGVAKNQTWLSDWTELILFYIFFSIMVYHRKLNIVPCAIQWDFVSYPFNT